jgi:RNase H-fold protein (predicted Holliday junction resolvase)
LNLLSNTHKDKVYDKEETLDNITYIGIDLGLKKTGFAFLDYSSNEINDDNIDYFEHIKSENIGYNLNDLKPDSKPYEKIKDFFNKYIKKDSIIRIIIEIPFFKKNEKTKANQRDFIIETFEILLNEIKNKYEIKFIYAND